MDKYFDKQIYGTHNGHAYYILVDENKKETLKRVWASVEATNKAMKNLLDNGYIFLLYYDNQPVFVQKDSKIKDDIKQMYEDVKR